MAPYEERCWAEICDAGWFSCMVIPEPIVYLACVPGRKAAVRTVCTFDYNLCAFVTLVIKRKLLLLWNEVTSKPSIKKLSSSLFNFRDPGITHNYETSGIHICQQRPDCGFPSALGRQPTIRPKFIFVTQRLNYHSECATIIYFVRRALSDFFVKSFFQINKLNWRQTKIVGLAALGSCPYLYEKHVLVDSTDWEETQGAWNLLSGS